MVYTTYPPVHPLEQDIAFRRDDIAALRTCAQNRRAALRDYTQHARGAQHLSRLRAGTALHLPFVERYLPAWDVHAAFSALRAACRLRYAAASSSVLTRA